MINQGSQNQEVNAKGRTRAMEYVIQYNQVPPDNLDHDPELQDNDGNTIAMLLAQRGIPIPDKWKYEGYIRNSKGQTWQTIQNHQQNNSTIVDGGSTIGNLDDFTPLIDRWLSDSQQSIVNTIETEAMKKAKRGQMPGQQDKHDPSYIDIDGNTVSMLLVKNKIVPSKLWHHDPLLRNNNGQTVEDILKQNGMNVPKEWITNQQVNSNQQQTQIKQNQHKQQNKQQAQQQPQQFQYQQQQQPQYQQQQQQFQQQQLQQPQYQPQQQFQQPQQYQPQYYQPQQYNNGQNIPQYQQQQQYNNQNYQQNQNNNGQYYQYQPVVEDSHVQQSPRTRGRTQAMILAEQGNIPQKQQNDNPAAQDNDGWTVAMILAFKGIVPPIEWNHNPNLKNSYGNTVAMYLASKGIIPQQQWYHDPNITNKKGFTVQIYLQQKHIQVPQEWIVQQQPSVFLPQQPQQPPYQYPPYPPYPPVNPYLQINQQAFYQARNGIIPQRQYYDRPEQQDQFGNTVAMYLAQRGIIPPKQWNHNPKIQNQWKQTVEKILMQNRMPIPNSWYNKMIKYKNFPQLEQAIYGQQIQISKTFKPEYQNIDGWTVAMVLARFGINNIQKQFQHNKYLMNRYGQTVNDLLTLNNKTVTKEWKCSQPILQQLRQFLQQNKKFYNWKKVFTVPINNRGQTIAMLFAQIKIIPPREFQHDPSYIDIDGNTVAMLLAKNKIIPQNSWFHNPYITNRQQQTVQQILEDNGIEVPENWKINFVQQNVVQQQIQQQQYQYNSNIYNIAQNVIKELQKPEDQRQHVQLQNQESVQDDYKNTIAMYIAMKGLIPPQYCYHDPTLANLNNLTVEDILLGKRLAVPDIWQKQRYLQPQRDQNGNTAAMNKIIQKDYNIDITEYHLPQLVNKSGYTVAMLYAENEKQIPQQWQHSKYLRNSAGETVQEIYKRHQQQQIQDYWKYDENIFDENGNTKQMLLIDQITKQQDIPLNEQNIDPTITNKSGQTVAMIIAQRLLNIPQCWFHNPNIQDCNGNTVAMIQAFVTGQPQQNWYHIPELQNNQGDTVAMIQAEQGIPQTGSWVHKPEITNKNGNTVAMLCAQYGKFECNYVWRHNPILQNDEGETVAMILIKNNVEPSQFWQHDPQLQDKKGNTVAMFYAINKKIPPEQWKHDKLLKNKAGQTVDMILRKNKINIPEEWKTQVEQDQNGNTETMRKIIEGFVDQLEAEDYHDPTIVNKQGNTVAMLLAQTGVIPPKEWLHDKNLKNKDNQTIAMILSKQGILAPNQLLSDVNYVDNQGNSIKSNLQKFGYNYNNNIFTIQVKTQYKDQCCCICLTTGEQQFIQTKCGHYVCIKCYFELRQQYNNSCPLCRRQDWICYN